MQNHRIISGLTIFVMVLLVAAGWFLVAQPQLAAANTSNQQLGDVQTQIATTEQTIAQLKSETKKLPSLKKTLAGLRSSIPTDGQVSDYIKTLNALAAASGVSITGIKVDDARPYTPPVVVAAPDPSASASPSPSPSASATAAPVTAPTGPTAWTPTSDPLITAANFVAIPVEVTTSGNWPADLAFIKGMQSGERLFLVNGIGTTIDAQDATLVNADITGFVYVILDAKGAKVSDINVSATPTPTPTPTPTLSSSPNPSGSSTPTPTTSPTPTK